MLISCVPVGTLQASAEASYHIDSQNIAVDPGLPEPEELLDGYAYRLFFGENTTYGRKAGDQLAGDEKRIYDALVPIMKQIASGQRTDTVIGLGQEVTYEDQVFQSDAALTFTVSKLTQQSLDRVITALLTDLPYEMYWYDKVTGVNTVSLAGSVIVHLQLSFTVAGNYRGGDAYTVDCAQARSAAAAAANAAAIVAKYAAQTDYQKLLGYKDEICSLVEYDYNAANNGDFSYDNDPWQLIYVFDGDKTTNVVCEGYSKAFMYLCDQTAFTGDVTCITVSGWSGGAHMWNVVSIDGENYLADVTNSEPGTFGYDGRLFLAGGSGSIVDSYMVYELQYSYSDADKALWGTGADSILTLQPLAYIPPEMQIVDSGECSDQIRWTLDKNGVLTVSGTGDMPNYAMHSAPWYSRYYKQIKSVVVESGIRTVGVNAFSGLPNLTTVTFAETVVALGENSFDGCQSLTQVNLPTSLQIIGSSAFAACEALKQIDLPQNLQVIGNSAFYACAALETIQLPAQLQQIGSAPFAGCTSLTGIWVDANNEYFSNDEKGVLFDKNKTTLCQAPGMLSGDYRIPEGVVTVMPGAFGNCGGLTALFIPATVQDFTGYCVHENGNLSGIWADENSPYHWSDAYGVLYSKDKTHIVRAPEAITGSYTVENGVKTLDCQTFAYCNRLTDVIIPEGVTQILQGAFSRCDSLKTVTLPVSLEYIQNVVFWDTNALTDVYYAGTLEQWENINIEQSNERLLEAQLHYYGMHEHSYIYVDAKEPACDQVGWYAYRYCETCDDTTYVEIPALEHQYSGYLTPSTCVDAGYYTYICDRCGYSYQGSEKLPLSDHRWGAGVVTTQPTEQTPGVMTYTCVNCPETKTEQIPALEHVHDYKAQVTSPTCMEDGYTTHICACGDRYVDSYKTALGHSLGKPVVVTPAGCNTEGVQHKQCRRCDYYEAESIKPTGRHNYIPTVTPVTCTERGYTTYACTCGDSYVDNYVEPQGHDMGDWVLHQEATCEMPRILRADCSRCDYFETVKDGEAQHVFGSWQQVREATCLLGSQTRRDCTKCDYYETMDGPALWHDYRSTPVAPTYTEQGYTRYACSRCTECYDADFVPALGLPAPDVRVENGKLTWNEMQEASGYEIHRATSKTGKYTKVETITYTRWLDQTATVGKTYYYKVKALCAEDPSLNSPFSGVVSMAIQCASPELRVSVNSSRQPVLSWNKVTGAKKYEIHRSVDDGPYKKLTTVTKTTYTDTTAPGGTKCAYKVKALASKSTYNSPFSYEQGCYVVCAAPSLTAKIDTATGKPSLSWGKVTGAVGYDIYRSDNGGEYVLIAPHTSTVSYLDTDTRADNKYSYKVVALGRIEAFDSAASAEKTVTVTVGQPKLTGTINDQGKAVITWLSVEDAEAYIVYRSTSSSKSYKAIETVTDLSYTDTAITAGKTYYYKVVAVGRNSESAQSAYVKLTGKCDIPVLEVQAGSTGKPVLTWNKISGAKKYEIWRSVDGAAFKKLTTATKTTYTDTKATNGAECIYKVKALGSKSSYNGLFSAEPGCYVTCAAPTLTAKIDTATGKPSLSWSKVTGATGYDIYRSENGSGFEKLTNVTGTTYLDEATKADNKYTYYIVSVGKAEVFNSVKSAEKTVTVTVGQPKLVGSINEQGKAVITWQAVEDALKYEVYRSTSSSKSYKLVTTVTELTYTDTGITAGKTYYYKVVAVGSNSKSAQSAYVKLTGKCAQPVISVGFDQNSGKPVITWEKVSGAKKYDVYRSTDGENYTKLTTVTKTTYTDTKAKTGTFYYYQVRAVGSKSSYNSVFSQRRGCLCVCAKPGVTVKMDSKQWQPALTWKAVEGAGSYEIYRALRGGNFVLLATVTEPAYLDQTAQIGDLYRYKVKAVSSQPLCNMEGDQVLFSVPCEKVTVKAVADPTGKPALTWEATEGATVYAVYRSTKKSSGFKLCSQVRTTSYTDKNAKKGTTYYYYVTAMAQDTESAVSNTVKIKCSK